MSTEKRVTQTLLRKPGGLSLRGTISLSEIERLGQLPWCALTSQIEEECSILKECFSTFGDDIFQTVFREATIVIRKYLERYRESSIWLKKYYFRICNNLIHIVILEYIKMCEVKYKIPQFQQSLVAFNLYNMSHITCLCLENRVNSTCEEMMFVENVRYLVNLKEFQHKHGCTDNIILALRCHYKNLKKLQIRHSKGVTDISVATIVKFVHLTLLDVLFTSILTEGYAFLLYRLPQIENIYKERADIFFFKFEGDKIPSIKRFEGDMLYTNLLTLFCPNITHLCLTRQEHSDLSYLRTLNNLKCFRIVDFDYLISNISTLLKKIGPQLSEIRMKCIKNLNMFDLMLYCKKVETLSIEYCLFSEPTMIFSSRVHNPHFKNVKNLILISNKQDISLNLHLLYYNDLKVFHTRLNVNMNDWFVKNLLISRRVYRQITEFIAEDCPSDYLTMRAVKILRENCKNLKLIGNLATWKGVTSEEIVNLKLEIRRIKSPLVVISQEQYVYSLGELEESLLS